jgi:BirA family biotin operon repressor/biotin-[acetyl-CoA-carboxylase] ligase
MSLLYFTPGELCDAVKVTTAAASAVALAIERVSGKQMRIKWVNDIYNDSGKVCGILAETLPVGDKHAVIVGVGVNTGEISFPEELATIASSIGDIDGEENRLIALIANGILAYVSDPSDRSYMDAYKARFMLLEKSVNLFRADELVCSGRVVGVDDDGGLLLLPEGESEPIVVHSGEVTVRSR